MEWSELYGSSRQPLNDDINTFINSDLWHELNVYLQQSYRIEPKFTYSQCSAQKGWNIKYQKSGKSLCTLYPMPGYFIALVVIGSKEITEADLLISFCSEYTQKLYQQTTFAVGGKWLMIHVTDDSVLRDVQDLINLRVKPKG